MDLTKIIIEDYELAGVDSFITSAYCEEKGRYLTDVELDILNEDHSNFLQEYLCEEGHHFK